MCRPLTLTFACVLFVVPAIGDLAGESEARASAALATSSLATTCGAETYAAFLRSVGAKEPHAIEGSEALRARRALFERRCRDVAAQNAKVGARWAASLNRFADRTHAELRDLLGYRRAVGLPRPGPGLGLSFLAARTSQAVSDAPRSPLPPAVDWRGRLRSSLYIRNQGGCGSCWAVAAIGALEMHAELAGGNSTELSPMHLVRCMPNPQRCGGTGGCDGATTELAFAYAQQHGVISERDSVGLLEDGACEPGVHRHAVVSGFVRLPMNRGQPLMQALASAGPVTVAVDATEWFSYASGVFDGCSPDAIVNHAVLLVGYGVSGASKFWTIRNSWGRSWGEDGHIRLLRHDSDEAHCGVDRSPQEGFGCAGGPSEIRVCGMCGVLSDSSYPVGVRIVDGVVSPPSK